MVLKLQISRNRKIAVLLILLPGGFVCIASIVRITTIHTITTSTDLTWAMGQLFIWSCCEPFIGIICSCLPTLAPLFKQWGENVLSRGGSKATALSDFSAPSKKDHSFGRGVNKSDDTATTTTITKGEFDFRMPKKKREWSRLHNADSAPRLRDDDEIELRTEITTPEPVKECEKADKRYDIKVTRDTRHSISDI